MTDVALATPAPTTRAMAWRLAAIVLFLGLPLGCATVAALAAMTAHDATMSARRADAAARAIVHHLDRRPAPAAATMALLTLASPNPSLARAELQALAARDVEAAGGRVVEMRPADQGDTDAPGQVSVAVTLAIGNRGLLDLLYAIETGLPLLVVQQCEIRSLPDRDGRPGADLDVTLTLVAAWKAPAP